jgi:hypothetical protein
MSRSLTVCMGVRPGWFGKEIENNDICIIRGLTVAHKYYDPEYMKYSFNDVVSGHFECNGDG